MPAPLTCREGKASVVVIRWWKSKSDNADLAKLHFPVVMVKRCQQVYYFSDHSHHQYDKTNFRSSIM